MNYAKVKNGQCFAYPYGFAELEFDNPPSVYGGDSELVASFNASKVAQEQGYSLVQVEEMPIPTFDAATQLCTLSSNPALVDGRWVLTWTVENKTQEELNAEIMRRRRYVRGLREEYLKNSDWTQVADTPVDKAAWATYRQALRDIPLQAGFPDSVVWPEVPSAIEVVRV